MNKITYESTQSYLHRLNDKQREAVLNTEGPLLVLAGAGTGKTSVITCRIAFLIDRGVPPNEILAVTFTKKAAQEMKQRVENMLGGTAVGLTICTFHALGYRFLVDHKIRTRSDGSVNILTAAEQAKLVTEILIQLDIDEPRNSATAIREISLSKAAISLDSVVDLHSSSAQLIAAYQKALDDKQQVDFDDLLILPLRMLAESSDLRTHYHQRWRYILVDEYQDTNALQHRLIRLLVGKDQNVCVVGDDDQSIYGFRGANTSRILNFEHEFPNANVIKLEQNYRSAAEILSVANSVIERAAQRAQKRLKSQNDDPGFVIRREADDAPAESTAISSYMMERRRSAGVGWSEMAVLFRVLSDSLILKNELCEKGIPFGINAHDAGEEDKVSIMTLHRSKGLEFPIVFLPVMEEDTLPHFHAIRSGISGIEEERRLLYVGITRARRELMLTSSGNRRGRSRTPSRFLTEIGL